MESPPYRGVKRVVPSAPLGTRKTQRKQEGGKGVGIANGGRFRRRRLPKFLNENNAPLAVTTAEWTGLDDGNVTMPA